MNMMAFEIGHTASLALKLLDPYDPEDVEEGADDKVAQLLKDHPELAKQISGALEACHKLYQSAMAIDD